MKFLRRYLNIEAQAGLCLSLATILAIVAKNTSWCLLYEQLMALNLVSYLGVAQHFSLLEFINDGLMTIFFFFVSLELKRELYAGHLSKLKNMFLPAIAAFGGMLVPAIIYLIVCAPYPQFHIGATIPVATDIAFAVSLFRIVANHTPYSLKVTLLSLAIFDDLGSIVLIALLYSQKLNVLALGLSLLPLALLMLGNRNNHSSLAYYLLGTTALWLCFVPSGLHPTLAGVLGAFCVPLLRDKNKSPLHQLENLLHHYVSFGVLPIFAFANGGIALSGFSAGTLTHPVALGSAIGLAVGKPIGVLLFSYIGMRLRLCALPEKVCWEQYFGMALLTGVGFTMSLFLGLLAFPGDAQLQTCVRLGVLCGTTVSSTLGMILFQSHAWRRGWKAPEFELLVDHETKPQPRTT